MRTGLPKSSALLCLALLLGSASSQEPTGTIAGAVTDPSGAVLVGAKVTLTRTQTGFAATLTTSSAGTYRTGALLPGDYSVRVEAPHFATTTLQVTVEVGRVTTANASLPVGEVTQSITVDARAERVNTTQSTLQGVITQSWIRELPLNGRNFLELGQLEPGAQINDGGTVTGVMPFFSALGVNGQSGILNRVTVDGADIGDQIFGGVAANLSEDSIQEFQVSRSGLDVATGLTGGGAVNIVTKGGGNAVHGSGFVFWRDDTLAARISPEPAPFDREHAGFSLGGPFRRDRLFWFVSYERVNQDGAVATAIPPFPQFTGTWSVPFDERMASARLDGNVSSNVRVFARFLHDWNQGIPTGRGSFVGGTTVSAMAVRNNSNQTTVGIDAVRGRLTHSGRFAYFNADTRAEDGGPLIPGFPITADPAGRALDVGFGGMASSGFPQVGPNLNVPMHRFQDTYETRYDGSFNSGRHSFHWGALVDLIRTNWYEAVRTTPTITVDFSPANQAKCGSDVLCYPALKMTVGNGLGWFTEVPTDGQPHGGFKNSRVHAYIGDTWRARRGLQWTFGLRWVYEPGQDSPDLLRPAILDSFRPGLANNSPRNLYNLAPQVGFAWDPTGKGQWVVRGGAGLYYDTKILKDNWGVRAGLIPAGLSTTSLNSPNRILLNPNTGASIFNFAPWVGQPLGTPGLIDAVLNATAAYQAAYALAAQNYPNSPSNCETARSCEAFGDYRTPYTLQFNVGMERELRPGLVLAVDYVRHRGLHYLLRQEANRLGAADTLDVSKALTAIAATNASLGCGNSASAAAINCAIGKNATIDTYASRGLGRSAGASSTTANRSAFPGENPNFNTMTLNNMNGSSTYNALQVQLRGQMPNAGRVLRDWSLVVSYSLSRLESTSNDAALVWIEADNLKRMYGPSTLDRTHIFSAASAFQAPGGVRISTFWRAMSALPQSVFVPSGGEAGGIFKTDFDGDGGMGDALPGTGRGSYGRDIGCGATALNRLIDRYNSTEAGTLTPAGQALVSAGLFTQAQLVSLKAVKPQVLRAPDGQVCLDGFMTADARISRPIRLRDGRITIEPAVEWFNVFNVANFDLSAQKLNPVLTGTTGSINGTTTANRYNRAGFSGGSMSIGGPRSWQLSLRLTF